MSGCVIVLTTGLFYVANYFNDGFSLEFVFMACFLACSSVLVLSVYNKAAISLLRFIRRFHKYEASNHVGPMAVMIIVSNVGLLLSIFVQAALFGDTLCAASSQQLFFDEKFRYVAPEE